VAFAEKGTGSMATAASDKPAQEEEGTGARRGVWQRISTPLRFLRRIPTALLVTLLGIGLSAWILPAVSRQWDDRQKARELQSNIAQQVAVASSQTIRDLVAVVDSAGQQKGTDRFFNRWNLNKFRIGALLDAYFPNSPAYSEAHSGYIRISLAEVWRVFGFQVINMYDLASAVGNPYIQPKARRALTRRISRKIVRYNDTYLPPPEVGYGFGLPVPSGEKWDPRPWVKNTIPFVVSEYVRLLTSSVLGAHPRGFSITRSDLFHDLLP
jgi:hypothetical protein